MLTSNIQLKASQEAAADLRRAITAPVKAGIPEKLVAINRTQLERKLAAIEADIKEFERNQEKESGEISIESFDDLLKAPIRYRLAKGKSVTAFAKELGIAKRQLLRYEAEQYLNCSVPKLLEICSKIGIKITGHIDEQSSR